MKYNQIQISNSPTNGKARVVDINGIIIRPDLQRISLLTTRKFYEINISGSTTGFTELNGVDYSPYEWSINADNNKLCNPANGLRVYQYSSGDTIIYRDIKNNQVLSPIGFYDYFQPMLLQPVATIDLAKTFVLIEDNVYHSYD